MHSLLSPLFTFTNYNKIYRLSSVNTFSIAFFNLATFPLVTRPGCNPHSIAAALNGGLVGQLKSGHITWFLCGATGSSRKRKHVRSGFCHALSWYHFGAWKYSRGAPLDTSWLQGGFVNNVTSACYFDLKRTDSNPDCQLFVHMWLFWHVLQEGISGIFWQRVLYFLWCIVFFVVFAKWLDGKEQWNSFIFHLPFKFLKFPLLSVILSLVIRTFWAEKCHQGRLHIFCHITKRCLHCWKFVLTHILTERTCNRDNSTDIFTNNVARPKVV